MTPPVTTDALVEALTQTMWEQSYGTLANASWAEAHRIAEAIPDGQAAWNIETVRRKAAEIANLHFAPALQQVTAERDEARAATALWQAAHAVLGDKAEQSRLELGEAAAEEIRARKAAEASLATATSELARLRAEGEAKDRALKAKAEEQVAYWRERQRAERCLEDGVSEDGQNYTPIGDVAAWQGGYCNGRMSEADWWAKTFQYWPNEAARAATAREGQTHTPASGALKIEEADRGLR